MSLALATVGNADRALSPPWEPLAAARPAADGRRVGKVPVLPAADQGWRMDPYCVADALAHIAAFRFTFREAGKAAIRLGR
jgi:hypothetical protein